MIVSNGTPCDEFYEILDSLYISATIVEDIRKVVEQKHTHDSNRHANYEQTAFAKSIADFTVDVPRNEELASPLSLFVIPVLYYNSLPNNKRYMGEISTLVAAVIKIFEEELMVVEKPIEARLRLCQVLSEQFELFVENCSKFTTLSMGNDLLDHPVVDIVYRKIKNTFSDCAPDNCNELIEAMRALIKK